jgi:hypothetical protein
MYARQPGRQRLLIAALALVAWRAACAAEGGAVLGAACWRPWRRGWPGCTGASAVRRAVARGRGSCCRRRRLVLGGAAAGLPLACPSSAVRWPRSEAPGALATFNYAWKLVGTAAVLAVQLVATLAWGPSRGPARRVAPGRPRRCAAASRWPGLACAPRRACWWPPAVPSCFGWGACSGRWRRWRVGAASAPGACCRRRLIAFALARLAALQRLRIAVLAYAPRCWYCCWPPRARARPSWSGWTGCGPPSPSSCCAPCGRRRRGWLPWRALGASGLALLLVQVLLLALGPPQANAAQWAAAVLAAAAVFLAGWLASRDLRSALAR